jgi:hypothetical protein
MARSLLAIVFAATLPLAAAGAAAQQASRLACEGHFQGLPAMLGGLRQFVPATAAGDGHVRFHGQIAAAGVTGEIAWQGDTATAPFAGYVSGPQGTIAIGVLDNSGGRMIIYGGAASLGPPPILGAFACDWRPGSALRRRGGGRLAGDDLVLDVVVDRLGHDAPVDQLVLGAPRAALDDRLAARLADALQRHQLVLAGGVDVDQLGRLGGRRR